VTLLLAHLANAVAVVAAAAAEMCGEAGGVVYVGVGDAVATIAAAAVAAACDALAAAVAAAAGCDDVMPAPSAAHRVAVAL